MLQISSLSGVFKSRIFSLISRIPNERTSIWKLRTKHERRKQGGKRGEGQRAKRIEGEGLTRGKVNTRGFAMDIVKARTRNSKPLLHPLFLFLAPCWLRGLHLTPPGYSIPRDLSDSLIFTSLGVVLRTGAATESC